MTLDVARLSMAMNAHWEWMQHRLHVCVGTGCAASIAREYERLGTDQPVLVTVPNLGDTELRPGPKPPDRSA